MAPARRRLGPEAARNWSRRVRERFIETYLSGEAVLDIGYRGDDPESEPITERAIGVDLDYPGYDGKRLPFADASQDAVFASHVLEHIEDWAAALADWYRVLKIDGHLIIAVPHRDLYERKADLPSRFNLDHKRFYTPASLLAEIEAALPVAGYRIRSLRDIDEGFDGSVPPEEHAHGCYEIELVMQKIAVPVYAARLRPLPAASEAAARYAALVADALRAARRGDAAEVQRLQQPLCALPMPPFAVLRREVGRLLTPADGSEPTIDEFRPLLAPLIARRPFAEDWYLRNYPDVAAAAVADTNLTAHRHYVWHGYFEDRSAGAGEGLFG